MCSIGVPSGRVMACTRPMPGMWKMLLAIRSMTSMSAGLRTSWSVSTQQQFGVHPGLREMPVGGGVSLVGRDVGGQVVAVVVVRSCTPAARAVRPARARSSRPGSGRASARRPCRPGASTRIRIFALGFEQAEPAADGDARRAPASARRTPTTSMPIASGTPSVWKYGSRVKCRQNVAPAMVRPEPRITWAVPWIHGVVGGFAVLAGRTAPPDSGRSGRSRSRCPRRWPAS